MNITLIAVAIVIIAFGVVTSRGKVDTDVVEEFKEVLSEETTSPEETPEPSSIPDDQQAAPTPTVAATASPSPSAQSSETSSTWIYPDSSVVSSGATTVLASNDSTDDITNWYRNKIESGGFNVKNSVKTSANDEIKNVISAANSSSRVDVEITKSGNSEVRIEVKVSSN